MQIYFQNYCRVIWFHGCFCEEAKGGGDIIQPPQVPTFGTQTPWLLQTHLLTSYTHSSPAPVVVVFQASPDTLNKTKTEGWFDNDSQACPWGALIHPTKGSPAPWRAGTKRPLVHFLQIQASNPYLLTPGTVLFLLYLRMFTMGSSSPKTIWFLEKEKSPHCNIANKKQHA